MRPRSRALGGPATLAPPIRGWRRHAAREVQAQGQASPQTLPTSPTQTESQELLQQNESTWQIDVTHGSQPEVSAAPVTHLSWTQLPLHDIPQTLPTSPTQTESQEVVQQNGSTWQIEVTQGSQPEMRATPVEQSGWLQVPPGHWMPHTLGTAPTQRSSQASVQQNES